MFHLLGITFELQCSRGEVRCQLGYLTRPEGRTWKILKRSFIINILLTIGIGLVGLKTYEIWQQDDWRPVKMREKKSPVTELSLGGGKVKAQPPKTDVIVERNLFDVRRGSGGSGRSGAGSKNGSGIEGLVLLGTIVTDGEQFAIVKVPPEASVKSGRLRAGSVGAMKRLALGDTVWGFELIEIQAERVIFKKGASEVELGLDFTRNHINVKPARSRSQNRRRSKRAVRKGR